MRASSADGAPAVGILAPPRDPQKGLIPRPLMHSLPPSNSDSCQHHQWSLMFSPCPASTTHALSTADAKQPGRLARLGR